MFYIQYFHKLYVLYVDKTMSNLVDDIEYYGLSSNLQIKRLMYKEGQYNKIQEKKELISNYYIFEITRQNYYYYLNLDNTKK